LKSLQECLESDFLYSITNVYQSIYDTVDLTHSNKESAAIATAKGKAQNFATRDDFFVQQLLQHLQLLKVMLIQELLNCQTLERDLDSM